MFKGSMVAIITPMQVDGSIDKKAMQALIEWHIQSGTEGIIVVGSTGESATLNHDEQFDLISFVIKQVAGRIPVIAGTGSNSTNVAIHLTENAKRAGADAALLVTPYYNKPPQQGLYQHYKAIAEAVDLPIIMYNVPGRTGCDLLPETIEQLAGIKNIIGVKEATGKIDRAEDILKRCGADFFVYSGDDDTGMELMLHGAKGVISVTANVAPQKMVSMCEAALQGNRTLAEKINAELQPLHKKLFLESNPIPAKYALHCMGKIQPGIRLPLLPLDKRYHEEVKQAMQNAGVI